MKAIIRRSSKNSLEPNWISGLIDGEGSFMILFSKNKKFNTNWEVRPSFAISLNKKDFNTLEKLQGYFNCGGIRFCKKDNTYKYEVRSLKDLRDKIVPHFLLYKPVIKQKEFRVFKDAIDAMSQKRHLSNSGLVKIAKMARSINRRSNKILPDL